MVVIPVEEMIVDLLLSRKKGQDQLELVFQPGTKIEKERKKKSKEGKDDTKSRVPMSDGDIQKSMSDYAKDWTILNAEYFHRESNCDYAKEVEDWIRSGTERSRVNPHLQSQW